MDYTEIRNQAIKYVEAYSRVNPSCFDTTDTIYYDETDNIKKFILKENGFNVASDSHFVLGGIATSDNSTISLEDLKAALQLQQNVNEVKSKNVYENTFEWCLQSNRLAKFLQLVIDKGWHIHFYSLNALHFSLVDIVDSIHEPKFIYFVNELKTILYIIVIQDLNKAIDIFNKYDYPDVSSENKNPFLDDLKSLVQNFILSDVPNNYKLLAALLLALLDKGKEQKELSFIQDNIKGELISRLSGLYSESIYMMPNAAQILDNESEVLEDLRQEKIELNGQELKNWVMVDSKTNPMIQCSDIVVGIICRYLKFVDRELPDVLSEVGEFNDKQMSCLRLINRILKKSVEYNPAFFHHISNIREITNFTYMYENYC